MYLKTLELHGFKSFPEKTVLHFNDGATVIVGPNGSGKSNITDAMRWVLGELSTKNIRGSKMEDVIFVGADGHRPMGFAEVSVTFDDTEEPRRLNSPYDVITVTRRYYRAGESEYFINRKPCRLKDINELFMNTGIGREGYSIIGQGRIAEIISKKSDDRRGIFEETAGISKARYKKQETQKKLDETESNMVRISDIYTEIESRIVPLEKDAKKARRYMELYGEKKDLDVALWLYDMERLRADIEKTGADCRMSEHELEIADDTRSQLEAQNDRLYSASQENKAESRKLYEEIKEETDKLHGIENAFGVLENDRIHAEDSIDAVKRENERLESDISTETKSASELESKAAEIDKDFHEDERKLFDLYNERDAETNRKKEKEAYIAERFEAQKKYAAEASEIKVRLDVLKNMLSDRENRKEGLSSDIASHKDELIALEKRITDAEASIAEYQELGNASEKEIGEASRRIAALTETADTLKDDAASLKAQIGALESRIGALKRMTENFEGYNNSVKFVMNEAGKGRLYGICGPVSHLIRVEEKYIIAVETALGANLQNIIVEDEKSAKGAMYALKRAGAGRATFYPMTTVKPADISREAARAADFQGFVGYACDLVKYDSKYDGILKYLLARIPVFDNIDNATEMARELKWKVRAVTLDGQQVNAGGSFTGGSARRDSGVLSRSSHIVKLEGDKAELEKESAEISAQLAEIEKNIASCNDEKTAYEDKKRITDALIQSERAVFDEYSAKAEVKRTLISDLASELAGIDGERSRGMSDVAELERTYEEAKRSADEIETLREKADIEVSEIQENIDKFGETLSELRISMAEKRKDFENTKALATAALERADVLKTSISENCRRMAELEERIRAVAAESESKKEEARALRSNLAELETKRQSLDKGSLEYERRLNEIRKKFDEVSAKKEILFVAHTKNETKLAALNSESEKMVSRLWDEYELTSAAALTLELPEVTKASRPDTARRLAELKSEIKALGHVNPDAVEEYAEQKARYDYLREQLDDLNTSKDELVKIIDSIEHEMKTMFVETFNKVNENFKEVFHELFGGGSAQLSLTDPENVLTSGIEISAAPPGKMIKNLSLLSGGEQAFVAIALLFALIKVNPSPFCIFDEIEAALDEVNVTRVANYVKRYSKELQMIVISHRRGMMEIADTLYGVTMPRHGVSKVFVLDVDSVSEKTLGEGNFVE